MLKNLTYKKKSIILVVVLILLLIIVYKLAIKRTIELKSQCTTMLANLSEAKDAPVAIVNIKNKLAGIENIVGKNILNGDDAQELILEVCSDYCSKNNLILKGLPRPHEFEADNYVVQTCILEVEGGFVKLLKLLYSFEQELAVGRIASVSFLKEQDRYTKTNSLKMIVYIQNVKSNNNEKDI